MLWDVYVKQFLFIFLQLCVDKIQNLLNSVLILINILTSENPGGLRLGLANSNGILKTPRQF